LKYVQNVTPSLQENKNLLDTAGRVDKYMKKIWKNCKKKKK